MVDSSHAFDSFQHRSVSLFHINRNNQCEEDYGHMGTLCPGKLYKIMEIKESYKKCAHNMQAAKFEMSTARD